MTFQSLGLAKQLLQSLSEEGYSEPTPIQTQAIPHMLAGKDVIAIAQTGTGKTAAFALPIIQRLSESQVHPAAKHCRVLVLSPTRELAGQIMASFRTYGRHFRLSVTTAIGGVAISNQVRSLSRGIDILVATPGRLLDLISTKAVLLDKVEVVVLDEADRMLDMGFINDIRKILRVLPRDRQTLLFSATMPAEIAHLAKEMLRDPVTVSVAPSATTVATVTQRVIHVATRGKKTTLLAQTLADTTIDRAIVFARTKHGADKIVRELAAAGIDSDALHGNKSQGQRERALKAFRAGKIKTLVATDIAARGIDVDGVSHVINYDLPNIAESYVHRIGRTARAGASGTAISFCGPDERAFLRDIEKLIRQPIPAESETGETIAAMLESAVSERPARNGRRDEGPRRARPERRDDRRSERPRQNSGERPRQNSAERPRQNSAERPRHNSSGRDRQSDGPRVIGDVARLAAAAAERSRGTDQDRPSQDRPNRDRPNQGRPADKKRSFRRRHQGGERRVEA